VRNNRAELDVPPETEQSVQSEYPQDGQQDIMIICFS